MRNLQALGHSPLAQDPDPERLRAVTTELGIPGFLELDEALNQKAEGVLICSPSAFHMPQATEAVSRGFHVFVEKPLSHNLRGTKALIQSAKLANLVVLVGCNMRFYSSLRMTKDLVDEGRIGEALAARVHGGYYLPYWRPGTDYRKGYGAHSDQGGGIILDYVHELDYVRWFFGDPKEVFCWSDKVSDLEIDTEDTAAILLKFPNRLIVELHLDYLQQTYRRGMEIIGKKGTIVWDFSEQSVQLFGPESTQDQVWQESADSESNSEINSMYVQEMEHFVRCIEGTEKPMADASDGRAVVELAVAARLSSQENRVVHLPLEERE